MPPLIIPFLVFCFFSLLALALMAPQEAAVQERLRIYGYRPRGEDLAEPATRRLLRPIVTRFAGLVRAVSPGSAEENIRQRLDRAGNPAGMQPTTFLALQGGLIVMLPALTLGISLLRGQLALGSIALALVLAVLGWRLPNSWLNIRIESRQKAVEKGLPDALDLIVVSVEAGNSLESALAQVTEKLSGPLSDEFVRTLREISLGKSRREALKNLSDRMGVADLQSFITAVIQADQRGVSIAQVLRVQADAMRVRRRQRAEELAAQLTVKMLFPLICLIFPAMFIVTVGPAALKLVEFFSGGRPLPG